MSYLLVLIYLVNLFRDNYLGNGNEAKIIYIYIYIYIYDLVIPLIMMISLSMFEMMNCIC